MITLEIIAGEAFIKRVAGGKAVTYTPADAERTIGIEVASKRAEQASAKDALHSALKAYRAALLSDGGCFAQRAAMIDAERQTQRLADEVSALDAEAKDAQTVIVRHQASLHQKHAAEAISIALAQFDLRKYA